MNRSDIVEFIEAIGPGGDVILADGLDEGFIGVSLEEEPPRAVYSVERCIKIFAEDMTQDEATEHFWHNVAGHCGTGYPLYISTPEDESPY
jgi:hypothetical protein